MNAPRPLSTLMLCAALALGGFAVPTAHAYDPDRGDWRIGSPQHREYRPPTRIIEREIIYTPRRDHRHDRHYDRDHRRDRDDWRRYDERRNDHRREWRDSHYRHDPYRYRSDYGYPNRRFDPRIVIGVDVPPIVIPLR